MTDIYDELREERKRQDLKFGDQSNHPDFDHILLTRSGGCTVQRMAEEYEIPTANRARWSCQEMFRRGQGTWGHILIEEVAETVDTCNGTADELRGELVQVAAVCVAWIEAIDKRGRCI